MPPSNNRSLYLQVGGTVDPLKTALKAGKSALAEFGGAANDTALEVEKAFAKLAGDAPAAGARSLEQAYSRAFANIRSNAQTALAQPTSGGALQIVNASAARQAADAAEAEASQLRLVAVAARAAADGTNQNSAAAKAYATAAEAVAIGAAEQASALRAQAAVLGNVEDRLRATGVAEEVLNDKHAKLGASGFIVEHVIRSMSDSIAAGQSPVRALSMEMGRITEAMTFFAATTGQTEGVIGKFAGFMGGPWGIAISLGVAVLTPLVAKLFESHDAAELAKLGADGLSDAQGSLGKIFDLTSGKIKDQNALLMTNARLTAINLRADAANDREKSDKSLVSTYSPGALSTLGSLLTGDISGLQKKNDRAYVAFSRLNDVRLAANDDDLKSTDPARQKAAEQRLTDTSARALKFSETNKFDGLSVTAKDYRDTVTAINEAVEKDATAAAIDKSLDTGVLGPKFKKDKKPKVDHSAEHEADKDRAYQNQLRALDDQILKAKAQLATSADDEYGIELEQITTDLLLKDQAVDDQVTAKKISAAEADILKGKNQDLATVQSQIAFRKKQLAQIDAAYQLEHDAYTAGDALAQIDEQLATTRKARLKIELDRLAAEQADKRAALQNQLDHATTDEDKANIKAQMTALPGLYAAKEKAAKVEDSGPLDQYRRQLQSATGDMNDALQSVSVDGFKGIEDGFVGIVSGTETVASAFKKMAASIISDLARIAIEKAIVGFLGSSFGGIFGGGGGGGDVLDTSAGFADGLIPGFADGIISGAGTGRSDSILALLGGRQLIRVSNGESIINADSTRRYRPLLKAINDNALPGFAAGGIDMGSLSMPSLSQADMRGLGRGGTPIQIHLGDTHLNAPGADPAQLARLETAFRQSQAELPARVINAVQDAKQRLVLR